MLIKGYYEGLYSHKSDNLGEMDKFIKRHRLSKFTQEETDNMNRLISIKEIESIINNLPKQKVPWLGVFISEFYQTFKEESLPILYSLFYKVEAGGILPN